MFERLIASFDQRQVSGESLAPPLGSLERMCLWVELMICFKKSCLQTKSHLRKRFLQSVSSRAIYAGLATFSKLIGLLA